jgi:hypothetical protein
MIRSVRTPLVGLFGFFIMFAGYQAVAAWNGANPSVLADLIWGFGFYILLGMWMHADAHARGIALPLDFGLLLYLFGPLYLPWYMWSTQRWRGIALAVLLLFAGYAPYLLGAVIRGARIA